MKSSSSKKRSIKNVPKSAKLVLPKIGDNIKSALSDLTDEQINELEDDLKFFDSIKPEEEKRINFRKYRDSNGKVIAQKTNEWAIDKNSTNELGLVKSMGVIPKESINEQINGSIVINGKVVTTSVAAGKNQMKTLVWDNFNPNLLGREELKKRLDKNSTLHHINEIKTQVADYYTREFENKLNKYTKGQSKTNGVELSDLAKYVNYRKIQEKIKKQREEAERKKREQEELDRQQKELEQKQKKVKQIMNKHKNVENLFATKLYVSPDAGDDYKKIIETMQELDNSGKTYSAGKSKPVFSKGCWNEMGDRDTEEIRKGIGDPYLNTDFLMDLDNEQLDKIDNEFNKGGKFEIEEYERKDGKIGKRLKKFPNLKTIEEELEQQLGSQQKEEEERKKKEEEERKRQEEEEKKRREEEKKKEEEERKRQEEAERKRKEEEEKKKKEEEEKRKQDEIDKLKEENAKLKQENNNLNNINGNLKDNLDKKDKDLNETKQQNSKLTNDLANTNKDLETEKDKNKKLQQDNQDKDNQIKDKDNKIKENEENIKQKEEENAILKQDNQKKDNQIKEQDNKIKDQQEQNNKLQQEKDELNNSLNNTNQKLQQQEEANKKLEQDNKDKDDKLQNLQNEINGLKAGHDNLFDNDISAIQPNDSLLKLIESMQKTQDKMNDTLNNLNNSILSRANGVSVDYNNILNPSRSNDRETTVNINFNGQPISQNGQPININNSGFGGQQPYVVNPQFVNPQPSIQQSYIQQPYPQPIYQQPVGQYSYAQQPLVLRPSLYTEQYYPSTQQTNTSVSQQSVDNGTNKIFDTAIKNDTINGVSMEDKDILEKLEMSDSTLDDGQEPKKDDRVEKLINEIETALNSEEKVNDNNQTVNTLYNPGVNETSVGGINTSKLLLNKTSDNMYYDNYDNRPVAKTTIDASLDTNIDIMRDTVFGYIDHTLGNHANDVYRDIAISIGEDPNGYDVKERVQEKMKTLSPLKQKDILTHIRGTYSNAFMSEQEYNKKVSQEYNDKQANLNNFLNSSAQMVNNAAEITSQAMEIAEKVQKQADRKKEQFKKKWPFLSKILDLFNIPYNDEIVALESRADRLIQNEITQLEAELLNNQNFRSTLGGQIYDNAYQAVTHEMNKPMINRGDRTTYMDAAGMNKTYNASKRESLDEMKQKFDLQQDIIDNDINLQYKFNESAVYEQRFGLNDNKSYVENDRIKIDENKKNNSIRRGNSFQITNITKSGADRSSGATRGNASQNKSASMMMA